METVNKNNNSQFLTSWEYNTTIEYKRKTYHIWECIHTEGYLAFTFTHQPTNGLSYVLPIGDGHYVGVEGVKDRLGIDIAPNNIDFRPK